MPHCHKRIIPVGLEKRNDRYFAHVGSADANSAKLNIVALNEGQIDDFLARYELLPNSKQVYILKKT
jgi:hypothetical protein